MELRKNMRAKAVEDWKSHRKRLRLECRECEVICERVVSPWRCLKNSYRYVYVFKDADTSYFGCLNKVFTPELDLAAFERKSGSGRGSDPYGSIRVARSPRSECPVTIEQAYAGAEGQWSCCNPTFFHHPAGSAKEKIRLITNIRRPSDADPDLSS